MKKKLITVLALVALVGGGAALLLSVNSAANSSKSTKSYEFTAVSRGKLETTVSATGTLAPVSTVSVLSQMSGIVEKVYADYNDHVKKGQVLVTLNTDMLKLNEKEAQAALTSAQASYDLAALDYQNNQTLAAKGLVAAYDVKSSKTALDVKAAALASAKSALDVIETELTQYAQVKSPIDGIVIDKGVDVGQSVVLGSSSNATTIYTLAGDLSKMEIKAEVDELDIASIKAGQAVRFTIESNPNKTYNGTVETIRLDPITANNVVYYYVIISANNSDGTLLPGMTANVEFIKEINDSAILVSNAALRFQPSNLPAKDIQRLEYEASIANLPADQQKAALTAYDASANDSKSSQTTKSTGLTSLISGGGPGGRPGGFNPGSGNKAGAGASAGAQSSSTASGSGQTAATSTKYLWYLDSQGKLSVKLVNAGSSDGINTELVGADALVGSQVILREKTE